MLRFTFKLAISLSLMFSAGEVLADGSASKQPFHYQLHNSNLFPWLDGSRSGLVTDTQGAMAVGLDRLLAEANDSVDFAVYGIEKQNWLLTRLRKIMRQKSSVTLRGVVDQERGDPGELLKDNFNYPDTVRLIKMLGKDRVLSDVTKYGKVSTAIMHNKLFIIDRESVWLGSTNLSYTSVGSEYNANQTLIIKSKDVAQIYLDQFNQMFDDRLFGFNKIPRERKRAVNFSDGTSVRIFFSPEDRPRDTAVIPFIRSAKSTLDIGMFAFTDERIAKEVVKAHERGVKVRLIYDAGSGRMVYAQHRVLTQAGIPVKAENFGGLMHMKTAIVDGKHVLMGSMNWTASGHKDNDENTIIVENNKSLAGESTAYFNQLWTAIDQYTVPGVPMLPEGAGSINSCSDGLDNDYDGKVDILDTDCANPKPI